MDKKERREKTLRIRVMESEEKMLQRLAEKHGQTVSGYIRTLIYSEAGK